MQNYMTEFTVQATKLENLLEENHLVHSFNATAYPITITISPDVSMDGQIEMLEDCVNGVASRDARLSFLFPVGEIEMQTYGRLYIPDSLMTKIKGIVKKMHSLWLQAYFANAQTHGETHDATDADFDGFYGADTEE